MEPLRIPSEAEFRAAYREDEDAVVKLFYETFSKFVERIQRLEDQIAKNSGNSSKPPSSDGLKKKPKSLRRKSGKKSSGQPGYSGHTLKAVAKPDHIQVHRVKCCSYCQANLEEVGVHDCERRQVFDVPPGKVEVTEHQVELKICLECHQTTVGEFPAGVTQPASMANGSKCKWCIFTNITVPLEWTA